MVSNTQAQGDLINPMKLCHNDTGHNDSKRDGGNLLGVRGLWCISVISGTRRKPPTCRKSLTNFII